MVTEKTENEMVTETWKNCKRPANICLFKVNNRSTRKSCEICLKLTIKTPERLQWFRFLLALVAESHYITFTNFDSLLLCRNRALPTNNIIRFSTQWFNRITENHWEFEGNYEAWIEVSFSSSFLPVIFYLALFKDVAIPQMIYACSKLAAIETLEKIIKCVHN